MSSQERVVLGGKLNQEAAPLRIVLQRPATHEAAQQHSLLPTIINTDLHKEAAALVGTVIDINAAFVISALG